MERACERPPTRDRRRAGGGGAPLLCARFAGTGGRCPPLARNYTKRPVLYALCALAVACSGAAAGNSTTTGVLFNFAPGNTLAAKPPFPYLENIETTEIVAKLLCGAV